MEIPETRYTRSGDVNIAYQVFGAGAIDLVYVPGWVSCRAEGLPDKWQLWSVV